jgi:hypothetical protein
MEQNRKAWRLCIVQNKRIKYLEGIVVDGKIILKLIVKK